MNGNATTLNVPEDSLNTTASANRSLCTADVERGEFVDEFTETNVEEGEVDGLRVVTNPAVYKDLDLVQRKLLQGLQGFYGHFSK
eukprot:8853196-Ditylum_brightwellii.AAC.1